MIISVSGKIESGKDTVGNIIQYLTSTRHYDKTCAESIVAKGNHYYKGYSSFITKKWADKLKDIVCILLNCTREQLEDHDFKNKELGEEWRRWRLQVPVDLMHTKVKTLDMIFNSETEAWEYNKNTLMYSQSVATVYSEVLTPRLLLQLLGTECGRDILHPNIWINALMSEYKMSYVQHKDIEYVEHKQYPNWIITDTRFPNELDAVKSRNGLTIKVVRDIEQVQKNKGIHIPKHFLKPEHESETALDKAEFDYIIYNTGTIEDLIEEIKGLLIQEKIITDERGIKSIT